MSLASTVSTVRSMVLAVCFLAPVASAQGADAPDTTQPQRPQTAGDARLAPQSAAQQLPPPRFASGIDLLVVDANVVDANGRPVEGLTAVDFRVSVDRRPRTIHTVQFVGQTSEAVPPQAPPLPRVSSNQVAARGRIFLLVVDEANLSFAETRGLDRPLATFLAGLAPGDRVGLVTIPAGGVRVDFTDDVDGIREALGRVTGLETFDSILRYNVGVSEMLMLEDRSPLWEPVVARECTGSITSDDAAWCKREVEAQARLRLAELRYRARTSLGAMGAVVDSLGGVEGPKTLVLLSGGMVLERQDTLPAVVAAKAAAANVTIYVIHLERPLVDAAAGRPSQTSTQDLWLNRQGLETVAGRARGDVFGAPSLALARIAAETSGYYLIGIEAEPEDRDGRARAVNVELTGSRRGLTLRSRREFRFDRPAAAGMNDGERLGTLVKSPTIAGEVRLIASAYTTGDPMNGKRQVTIAVEIDDEATAEAAMVVGYTIVDAAGQEHAAEAERLTLRPADEGRPSPLRYVASVSLDPGDYIFKLGVMAPDGRRGSIEHQVTTRATPAGRLQIGDLFVMDVPGERPVELRADALARVRGERVAVYCEIYAAEASVFDDADIVLEIAAFGAAEPVLAGRVRAGGAGPTHRVVEGALPIGALAPGDYVARLTVTDRDGVTGEVLRSFRVPEPAPSGAPGPRRP